MATLVHLVRHGQVENPRRLVYGRQPGWGLSARGREQARAVADHLARGKVTALYASPLQRAQETAAILGQRLELEVRPCEELMESTFASAWEGRPWDEVRTRARTEWETYRRDPLSLRTEEPLPVLARRVATAVERLSGAHPGGEIVAVSHGDPIKAAVLALTGASLGGLHDVPLRTGSVVTMEHHGGAWRVRDRWPESTGPH